MKLRFLNTYEPVVPIYQNLLPALASKGHDVVALLAEQDYRMGSHVQESSRLHFQRLTTLGPRFIPRAARKLLTSVTYAAAAAAHTSLAKGDWLNVFFTQPPLFHVWGRALKAFRNQRYCCVMMDLYPWVAIEAEVLSEGHPATRAMIAAERATLRSSSCVIAIGRCMVTRLRELGIDPGRIQLVPNWADTDAIQPVAQHANSFRTRLGLDREFVVGYSGNLGTTHYFDDLLEVARRLNRRKDIRFLVTGEGARLSEVRRAAERASLSNFIFLGCQPYCKLSASLGAADVHFVSLRENFTGLVVPSKTYGVMAAGRPIVFQGAPNSEIAQTVSEHELGRVVRQGCVDDLEQAFVELADNEGLRLSMGTAARRVAETHYSTAAMVNRYSEILGQCAS